MSVSLFMVRRKQQQRTLWEGVVDEDVRALWEPWMVEADKLLDDEELIDRVYEAQADRHEHSATRGRSQTPASGIWSNSPDTMPAIVDTQGAGRLRARLRRSFSSFS
jgi:hypothetical protein